jgi:hypothetical protein
MRIDKYSGQTSLLAEKILQTLAFRTIAFRNGLLFGYELYAMQGMIKLDEL